MADNTAPEPIQCGLAVSLNEYRQGIGRAELLLNKKAGKWVGIEAFR